MLLTAAAGLGRTRGRDPRLCPSAVDPLVTAAGRGGPAPLQEALPVRKALGRPRPAGSSSPAPRVVIPVSTVQREKHDFNKSGRRGPDLTGSKRQGPGFSLRSPPRGPARGRAMPAQQAKGETRLSGRKREGRQRVGPAAGGQCVQAGACVPGFGGALASGPSLPPLSHCPPSSPHSLHAPSAEIVLPEGQHACSRSPR